MGDENPESLRHVLIAKGIEDFSIEYYKSVAENVEGNFVTSPLGAHVALSLCAHGTVGIIAEKMDNLLRLPDSNSSESFKHFNETMSSSNEFVTFGIASKILTDETFVIDDTFKGVVGSFFQSEIEKVDFVEDNIVDNVNAWFAEQTDDKITNIMTPDDYDDETKMILLNAVYFKAYWRYKFYSKMTTAQPFYIDETTTIDIPTMCMCQQLFYKELKAVDAECVALPYYNARFLFVIIKPNKIDGLKNIEQNLEKIDLNYPEDFGMKLVENTSTINLSLPKFKIETSMNLNSSLQKLGLITLYSDENDPPGISTKPVDILTLHGEEVIQKTFIVVNEAGTETGTVVIDQSFKGDGSECPREFKVDRPFLYRIVHIMTNLTLLSGRVVQPMYS